VEGLECLSAPRKHDSSGIDRLLKVKNKPMSVPPASPANSAPALASPIAIALLLVSSLTVMANATIAPSLPGLKEAFAGTPGITTLTGLAMTLPSLSVVLTAWLVGILADRTEQRRLLLIGLIGYAIFGVSGALAPDMITLLAGRIGLGVGVAITMTVASAMVASFWQGPARQRFTGVQGAAMSGGGVLFLLAGGAAAALHWRTPFVLYAMALPIALLVLLALPQRHPAMQSKNAATPPLPTRPLLTVCGFAVFSMIMFYLVPTKLPFRLRELGITSTVISGTAIAAMTAASIPMALLYGRLRQSLQPAHILAISFLAMAAGYALIGIATSIVLIFAGSLVAGLGIGMLMPNMMSTVMSATPPQARGKATGLLTSAIFAGQFLSPLISGPLADIYGLPVVYISAAVALGAVALVLLAVSKTGL
jgi:MFS family permease